MNHLLLNTISDEAVLHAIGRGNVGDLFTVRSDGDQDSHKLWVAGLIHDAKKKGITLKREEKYETKIREPREGAVGLWHTSHQRGSRAMIELIDLATLLGVCYLVWSEILRREE
jgi:hypothetical protein